MIGGYFGLLNYCKIEDNHLSDDYVLEKLKWYKQHANNRVYDMIDYEWLIFLEIQYGNNENKKYIIQEIHELKQMVAKNYLLNQKLKARINLISEVKK